MSDMYVEQSGYGCPCSPNCPNRSPTCHAECKPYLFWRRKRDAINRKQKMQKDAEVISYNKAEIKKKKRRR